MLKVIRIGQDGIADPCTAHPQDQVMWISEIVCTLELPAGDFEPAEPRRFPLLPGHTSLLYNLRSKNQPKWTIHYRVVLPRPGCDDDGRPNDIIVDSSGPEVTPAG